MVHVDNHVNYVTVILEKSVLNIHLLVTLTTVLRQSLAAVTTVITIARNATVLQTKFVSSTNMIQHVVTC